MGAKPYPAYRDSGVAWIGEIPEHWEVKRLKDVADCRLSNVDKHTVDGEASVRLCNYVDVYKNDFITSDISFMPATATPNQISKLSINVDDVLITKDSESPDDIGVPALVKSVIPNLVCGYHLALIRTASHTQDGGYTFRFLTSKSATSQFYTMAKGITRYAIGKGEISRLLLPSPPLEEQKQIASFLDRETSKIDTLIGKQQQLINLLKEKRGSLISHTITKGLNPNGPMKDSGVEWIGEIPEHWEVKRLKDVAASVGVGLVINPSTYVLDFPSDEDVPMLLGSNVVPFGFNLKSVRRISPEDNLVLSASRLKAGDIVVVRVGAPGVAAVIPPYLDSSNCASVVIVRQHRRFEPQWLVYVLNSPVVSSQVDIVKYGAAQKQFNVSHAVAFALPSPPLEEQKQIAAFLDRETSKIDTLIDKANQSIALLKERRSSLISAAVTGKIDVREAA